MAKQAAPLVQAEQPAQALERPADVADSFEQSEAAPAPGDDAHARAAPAELSMRPVGGGGASQAAAVLAGAPLVATTAPAVGAGAPKASEVQHLASGQEPALPRAGSDHGSSTASSGWGGAALLGLVSALLFTVMLHWSTVRVPRVRWRGTVFLALPERPG